jgi:hypothetical protein
MARDSSPFGTKCAACESCPSDDCSPDHDGTVGSLRGWRLALASLSLFLLPVALATAGAASAGESAAAQSLGALGGLALGMGGAAAARSLLGRQEVGDR